MLVCATRWLSMHLYTLFYMFMHESCLLVCHPYFNTMKSWTSDPNLHLSFEDTTFCLLSCLSDFPLVCLLPCSFAYHVYHAYLLYASYICSLHLFPSTACLWLCTLLNPLLSSLPSFSLRWVVLGLSCHVPFVLTSRVW